MGRAVMSASLPATEQDLVRIVVAGMQMVEPDAVIATEIPSHGRARIDVCLVAEDESVWAIEAKLRDWRRAIGQAFLNKSCAHYSYVAIWHELVSETLYAEAGEFGLGILSVDSDSVAIALKAVGSKPNATMLRRVTAICIGES